jgi:hypothetical protein
MGAPDRLSLYNGALVDHLGEPPLQTLDDDVPVRYTLDNVWDRNAVRRCLQTGQWNFGARTAALEPEDSITPSFGYRNAFAKPDDFVRTMGVCSDEFFQSPLTAYTDETGFWWCDLDTLYVRFVSDDAQYGLNYAAWPHNFQAYVEGFLALGCCSATTYTDKRDSLEARVGRLLLKAQSTDAMEQPSKQNPPGSWTTSRSRQGSSERGSRNRLIG